MGKIRGIFDLENGVTDVIFRLEHRVCRTISGLITGLGEEMVAELQVSTC